MELLHAILYTSKFILGKGGNFDLYYFFSIAILGLYFLRRTKSMTRLCKCFVPFLIIAAAMLLFNPYLNYLKFCVYVCKLFLCTVVMVYVLEQFNKTNWLKMIYITCAILFAETIVALFVQTDWLWRLNDITNKYSLKRLELFYIEPSELSFHCGLILVVLFYIIYKNTFYVNWKVWGCAAILAVDMLLSSGMGGILALAIAVLTMLIYDSCLHLIKKYFGGLYMTRKSICIYGAGCVLLVFLALSGSAIFLRIQAVLSGKDYSFLSRFVHPLIKLKGVLEKTDYFGVGFGNLNTEYGLEMSSGIYTFPNSLPYFVAEAGLPALVVIAAFVLYLLVRILKTKDMLSLGLLMYILVYQIPGGYFTNPINYLVYGLILGRVNSVLLKAGKDENSIKK